jgi:hypothetical protein
MTFMTPDFPLNVEQGTDFDHTLQWYGNGKFIAPIENVEVGYPTILTVTAHLFSALSPTPVIISGVEGCPHLNSTDTSIALATRVTDDIFTVQLSTVNNDWISGTGEITYWKPVDLTDGWTGVCNIRKNWYSSAILHTISTTAGTMTLGADGSVRLQISNIDTAAFTFTGAVYDIDLTKLGIISRVFKGPISLHRDI